MSLIIKNLKTSIKLTSRYILTPRILTSTTSRAISIDSKKYSQPHDNDFHRNQEFLSPKIKKYLEEEKNTMEN